MGNKRISQLVELVTADVIGSDLLAIVDMPNRETKKITVTNFAAWVSASGSLFSVHSITADTASYILGSGIDGVVKSSSFSLKSYNADSASYTQFAQNSSGSLYAQTSSWAVNTVNGGISLVSGSIYNITSSWTQNVVMSNTASYLYYSGQNNGTASFAVKTGNVVHADTASFLNATFAVVSSASHAEHATSADTSINAISASFLQYNGLFNGTASFALNTSNASNGRLNDFGLFLATTQSINQAQIDTLTITPSLPSVVSTLIEAIGSSTLNFTSSIQNNDSISLSIVDRFTGISQILDTVPVFLNTTTIIDNWNTLLTGSISTPFLLAAQITNSGSFLLKINTTPNVVLTGSRITKFSISSMSDVLSTTSNELLDFTYTPTGSLAIFFSGSTGPFTDAVPGLQSTGSQNLTSINISNQNISSVRYIWKCVNLKTFDCSYNPFLQTLNYKFPSVLSTLICNNCFISNIYNMSNITSMSIFNCSTNLLTSLPSLPTTMSFISCSGNPLTSFPSILPFGLTQIICDNTTLPSVSTTFPNTVVSMSFQNNSLLQFFTSILPSGLVSFNASNSPIGLGIGCPTPSVSMSIITLKTCSLSQASMDLIFSQSFYNANSNSLYSGSIDVRNNGSPNISTYNNYIQYLTGSSIGHYNWNIHYDP